LYTLIFIFLGPAINWDSLTYHLTKSVVANQTGSWWYHPDVSVARVNIFGSNSSILNAIAFSVLGKDYLVELPQLIAALIIPLSLFYIGVTFFIKRKIYSFIATISVLSIPLYLYESKTTQNDLVFTAILLISMILVNNFLKNFSFRNLILTLFSLGILCGSKYHGIIAAGLLSLFIVYGLVNNRNEIKKKHILSIILLSPILVFLALPSNIIGGLYYHSPFALDSGDAKKLSIGFGTIWANIKHFGTWFYLKPIGDISYFSHDIGHAGFINMVAIPIFIFVSIRTILSRKLSQILFISTIVGLITLLFLVRAPDQWDLRLILFLPITAIFIATLFVISIQNKLIKLFCYTGVFIISLLNIMVTFYFVDWEVIKYSLWSIRNGEGVMSIGNYYASRYMPNIQAFEDDSKEGIHKVLIVGYNDAPLYPYYGDRWQNEVQYMVLKNINNEYLQDIYWDYLIIYHNSAKNILDKIEALNLNYNTLITDYYVNIYKNESID
jgi:hypothetical protein